MLCTRNSSGTENQFIQFSTLQIGIRARFIKLIMKFIPKTIIIKAYFQIRIQQSYNLLSEAKPFQREANTFHTLKAILVYYINYNFRIISSKNVLQLTTSFTFSFLQTKWFTEF